MVDFWVKFRNWLRLIMVASNDECWFLLHHTATSFSVRFLSRTTKSGVYTDLKITVNFRQCLHSTIRWRGTWRPYRCSNWSVANVTKLFFLLRRWQTGRKSQCLYLARYILPSLMYAEKTRSGVPLRGHHLPIHLANFRLSWQYYQQNALAYPEEAWRTEEKVWHHWHMSHCNENVFFVNDASVKYAKAFVTVFF
jgi:hypothetical protein